MWGVARLGGIRKKDEEGIKGEEILIFSCSSGGKKCYLQRGSKWTAEREEKRGRVI
jgi:hypothetical protein